MPLGRDQVRPLQRRQMRRHGVVRNAEQPGDLTGGQAVRLVGDEQPEGVQARGLGKSGKGVDGVDVVHMSRLIDIILRPSRSICIRRLGDADRRTVCRGRAPCRFRARVRFRSEMTARRFRACTRTVTMPQLVDGKWEKGDVAASEMKNGAFHREPTSFRNWITPDGSPGPDGQPALPAEAGRYQLFVAFICPWASRTLMMRNLKGLQDIISVSISEPELGENGWTYAEPQDAGPRVGKIRYQHELYTASDPHYTGKVSVPVLWDRKEGRIVNNESADIIRILNTAFNHLTGDTQDFYPEMPAS